jgi:hypothetical protein
MTGSRAPDGLNRCCDGALENGRNVDVVVLHPARSKGVGDGSGSVLADSTPG